jgi:hypothetical protein
MTWALVIGAWVAVALVMGLLIGAMIRRAEMREHEEESASQSMPAGKRWKTSPGARVSSGRPTRRGHPNE